jgi:1-acyl-sn-glycerol-3-phosphate acyltransferase
MFWSVYITISPVDTLFFFPQNNGQGLVLPHPSQNLLVCFLLTAILKDVNLISWMINDIGHLFM